jgi:signal transduction histidine kinase
MLCGYSLALVVDRRRAVLAGLALVPFVIGAILLFGRDNENKDLWVEMPKNLAFVAAPLLLGVAVRNRRDYAAALLERAETAERTREEEAARRVSEERLRIAQDVHDVVAHAMVAINVQAGVGLHLLDRDVQRARQTLADIRQASGDALTDLRATLGVLRSSGDEAPVAPALSLADLADLVAGVRSAGVEVSLSLDPLALEVPSGVGTTGYRIVQEALTNVVRHAGSARALVEVAREDGRVVISVDDTGGASPPAAIAGTGNGVRGMTERAALVGGTVEAGPHGAGWRVRAVLPVLPVLPS